MPPLTAPITAVTVFTDRARVTRRATTTLQAGEQMLTLGGLPVMLDPASVRVSGRGDGVRVLGVDIGNEYVTAPPEQPIAELSSALEALEDQDALLREEDTALALEQDYLRQLREQSATALAKGIAYGRASTDTAASVGSFVSAEYARLAERRTAITRERRTLGREIKALRARLEQVKPRQPEERRTVQVIIEATAATEASLDITYVTYGAHWQPSYDVRLVDQQVSLTYQAAVSQHTGEDWPAVALTLSTARAGMSSTVPDPQPWYLDVYRPPTPKPMMARMRTAEMADDAMAGGSAEFEMAYASAAPATPPMPTPIAQAKAAVQENGASVSYRVERPVAVPSDGSPHRTQVTTLDLPAKVDYVIAPKLAEEAYLRATIQNTSAFVLLPGQANIFHGEEFVGTSTLETIAPGAEFEAQLGVDLRLKVERKLTTRNVSKTIIGNVRRTQVSYTTTITSTLPRPAQLTVLDQIPHSRREEIKVRLDGANPRYVEQSDLGVIRWEITLPPQQSVDVQLGFTVEHPRDLTVTGLNV